jgi:hypothetical protein
VPKRSDQRRRHRNDWIAEANDRVPVPSPSQPPRSGRGASKAAWIAYATSLGHVVADGLKREEIIALVVAGHASPNEWHPAAREWFESLEKSGQAIFYQPSDWATAKVLAEILSRSLSGGKMTAALIERWQVGATELLTTEGARRRVRIELERVTEQEAVPDVAWLEQYRQDRTS